MIATLKQQPEIFDPLSHIPPGIMENPYPLLNDMRERAAILWSPKGNQWLVLRYEETNAILRNNKFGKRLDKWRHPNFIMRQAQKIMNRRGTNSILLQDPPDHTRVRALVNSAFTPRVVHALEDHICAISDQMIDQMLETETCDLISSLSLPLPVTVISELLGVPVKDRHLFHDWSRKITAGVDVSVCPMRLVNTFFSIEELRKYLTKTIDLKRKTPADDLLSSLVAAQLEDNQKLSEEELLANAILILIAGHETTTNLIGNSVINLLRHPDQLQLILDDPDTIPGAVEEVLRYDPAVQLIRRIVKEDTEYGGVKLRIGDSMTLLLGAANRDPRAFEDPERFDILRKNNHPLTFGAGIHYCLGAELARTEARIALRQLFKRMPNLKLANEPIEYKGPFGLRGPKRLMVHTNLGPCDGSFYEPAD